MVTNKDECVTTKVSKQQYFATANKYLFQSQQTKSHNFLIENIYCNSSGGCAIGSLGSGANVSNIVYRNVYTWDSNQMMMIKSNGGSGDVSNVVFENFIGT